MPIKQIKSQHDLSIEHGKWLASKFKNVEHKVIELENILNSIEKNIFLNIELKGRNTAEGSFSLIKKYVERNKIDFNNILFSTDNDTEFKKKVKKNIYFKVLIILIYLIFID